MYKIHRHKLQMNLKLFFFLKSLFSTGYSGCLLLTLDDESISVDLRKVFDDLLTDSECLCLLHVDLVGSLTRGAKLAVSLEMVLADVKLGARSGEFAGTVQTISFVEMWANLERGHTSWRETHRAVDSENT